MIGSQIVAVFAFLPWMWGLFQLAVFGNLWSIAYLIPYLLIIDNGKKKTSKGKNVTIVDSTKLERKDACIWTGDINCGKTTNGEMIEPKKDFCHSIDFETNPVLDIIANVDAHGTLVTNPFVIDDKRQWNPSGNPFLGINDTPANLKTEGGNTTLLSTNPFLLGCSSNQIIDISIFFPNGFDDPFADIPYAPTESDIYCKKWIDEHRKCFIKTARSFSIH